VVEIKAIVFSISGIHARPSRDIALKAKEYKCSIFINKEGTSEDINAKEILSLLSHGFEQGDRLYIKANGPDEQEAAQVIAHLIETLQY